MRKAIQSASRTQELQQFDPSAAALKIHGAEAAERAAGRAKNIEALERAVTEKLEAQRDFARCFVGKYKHGGDRKSDAYQVASTGNLIPAEDYCRSYGFAYRTVARWAEKLLDDASFEIEKHQRLLKAWQICEMPRILLVEVKTEMKDSPNLFVQTREGNHKVNQKKVLGNVIEYPVGAPKLAESD